MDTPTQTDISVQNQNGKKGVTTAVQTTYALSKSESTDSSIRAQLEVATTHDNEIEGSISRGSPRNGVSRQEPGDEEPYIEPTELKSSTQVKKSVSVLDGNVITRRCDNQQWKVTETDGKQSQSNKTGDISRAPTKIVLNLKLDVGEDLAPEDLEIAIVARSSKAIKADSSIDNSEVDRTSQIPEHKQNMEKISKEKYDLVLMNETNMTVTPEQVPQQYVHTLMPLSDEFNSSVHESAGQHMKDSKNAEFSDSNLSMNSPRDRISGKLRKVTSLENIFAWGIPAVPEERQVIPTVQEETQGSDPSVYTLPVKKDKAYSHLDEMEVQSHTSLNDDIASMKSLLNPVDTRMILEIQHQPTRSTMISGRPSAHNELAIRLKLTSDETLTDADEIKLVLQYDTMHEENDSERLLTAGVGDDSPANVPPSVITVELHKDTGTTVHYTHGTEQKSELLIEGGPPVSVRLSAEGPKAVRSADSRSDSPRAAQKMRLSATRDGYDIGAGSVAFEADGDPVVMSVPMGDDNLLLTLTTKIVKKNVGKTTTEPTPAAAKRTEDGKPLGKTAREAAEEVADEVVSQLYSNYAASSRLPTLAHDSKTPAKRTTTVAGPDEGSRNGTNVRMTTSSVTRAIAEAAEPLNAAFDEIMATLADTPDLGGYGNVARPHSPNLEQTSRNCLSHYAPVSPPRPQTQNLEQTPRNYPPYYASVFPPHYAQDCRYVNHAILPPRYLPECHRYESRHYESRRYEPRHYESRRYDRPTTCPEHSPRCPLAEMHVTLSQHRNVVHEYRDGARGAVTGATGGKEATAANTDAKDRVVFDNIAARCNKCGSEAVELRSKTQVSGNQQSPSNTNQRG